MLHIPAALEVQHRCSIHQQSESHQRLCGRCVVQEGREVLVRVCVLVLVVVLMELEGQGRDARLVLRRPAWWTRCGVRRRWSTRSGATCSCCIIFTPWDTASALALWWIQEVRILRLTLKLKTWYNTVLFSNHTKTFGKYLLSSLHIYYSKKWSLYLIQRMQYLQCRIWDQISVHQWTSSSP